MRLSWGGPARSAIEDGHNTVFVSAAFPMALSEGRSIRLQHTKTMRERLAMARVHRARSGAGRLFEEGLENRVAGTRGTLRAAYNGVAEHVDQAVTYRDGDRRLDAIWFGSGYLSKARACRVAVQSAAAWKN